MRTRPRVGVAPRGAVLRAAILCAAVIPRRHPLAARPRREPLAQQWPSQRSAGRSVHAELDAGCGRGVGVGGGGRRDRGARQSAAQRECGVARAMATPAANGGVGEGEIAAAVATASPPAAAAEERTISVFWGEIADCGGWHLPIQGGRLDLAHFGLRPLGLGVIEPESALGRGTPKNGRLVISALAGPRATGTEPGFD